MNYLVSIYFDEKTDKRIRNYISAVAEKCGNMYMLDHHVPPHITISAFETADEEIVLQNLENCVSQMIGGTLQWVTTGAFNTGVLYVAPILNEYLHELAAGIGNCVKILPDVKISKYYQPFQWFPHTTIAKKLSDQEMPDAFGALQSSFAVFEGKVVRIGLAQKNPYREIREWEILENVKR